MTSRRRSEPGSGQPTAIPEKVCRPARARTSSPPPSSSARPSRASTDSPRCGPFAPTAAASAGWAAPKRPSSSSVHRKREFSGGGPPTSGAGGSSGGAASRPSAAGGGAALAAPRAGIDAKSHVAPAGAGTRAQRKLTLIRRRSTTKRMPSSRGGSPTGSVAARWRRRRALGPSPRSSRRFERVRVIDLEQCEHGRARGDDPRRRECDRQPRVVAEPVRRRQPRVESRGFLMRLDRGFKGRTAAASGSKSALVNDSATGAGGGRWGRRLGPYR